MKVSCCWCGFKNHDVEQCKKLGLGIKKEKIVYHADSSDSSEKIIKTKKKFKQIKKKK
jgi:hypothetical protein